MLMGFTKKGVIVLAWLESKEIVCIIHDNTHAVCYHGGKPMRHFLVVFWPWKTMASLGMNLPGESVGLCGFLAPIHGI